MRITRTRRLIAAAAMASTVFLLVCTGVSAQEPQAAAPAPAAKPFKEEELASLLAPIALYPDTVVAQILMASTYPLEVIEARRWVEKNQQLQGEALATEAKKQPWDQSVQALTAFPDVLKMMDEKLDWMQKLGDAFLAQQADVMAMVQTLRGKAKDAGNLKSDEHQTVKVEPAAASSTTTTIIIEPADPQVIYVPTYSPQYAYGYWAYPSYPPYYYYPPAYNPAAGFWWGVSVGIGIGVWGGAWNNNCDWNGGNVNINTGDINIGSGNRGDRNNVGGGNSNWQHNPEHRKGASYRDSATAQKYNRGSSAGASSRDSYRGRSSTGASAGTRDVGGAGGASAGTRDVGGGSRSGSSASSRGSSASSRGSSSSSAFGGSSSGSRASSYSSRGGSSRGGGGMSRGGGGRRR
jgi:hypothetical protein